MNKVPEFWERVEITNKTEEEFRRKLLTLEKSKAKTAFITIGARADRSHAGCWPWTSGMGVKRACRERLFLGVAAFSGPHT